MQSELYSTIEKTAYGDIKFKMRQFVYNELIL